MAEDLIPAEAWSAPARWGEISAGKAPFKLAAPEETLPRIARSLGLEGLSYLEAELVIRPWFDGVEIQGRVKALSTRLCGVTLTPFEEAVDDRLHLRIVPPTSAHAPDPDAAEIVIDLEAEDPPDILQGDMVDLGAYLVEHLALALDPFPRRPGAVFQPDAAEPGELSPFAKLRGLRLAPPDA